MRMLVRLVLGLFVLKAVVASPRFSRQADLDSYDTDNYDVDIDDLNSENQENYDYEDGMTTADPEVEIGRLDPDDYNLGEKEDEEEEEAVELPLKPFVVPQGSGGSGVLMGPNTQKEVELRLAPSEVLHISGDFEGSVGSETSAASGASGSGVSGHLLVSGDSGSSGDIVFTSGASHELFSSGASDDNVRISGEELLGSSGSGEILVISGASGELLGSGGSGDSVRISGASDYSGGSGDILLISGASEELLSSGGSGDSVSGASGEELLGSSASGEIVLISGASEELLGSGDIIHISGASELLFSSSGSGEFLVSGDVLISGDLSGSGDSSGFTETTTSGASGDLGSGGSGISGSGVSGDQSGSGFSGDLLSSGAPDSSGVSGVSGESGDVEITLLPGEEELPLIPTSPPHEVTGDSEEISGVSGISGASGKTETSGDLTVPETFETSGVSGETEVPEVILLPDDHDEEEEERLPTTPQTSQEVGGTIEGSVSLELPEPLEPEEPGVTVTLPGMPTCLLCTCLGGSVYCDDLKLDSVPPLPKDTTHFYARYNRITKIHKSDFASMNKLKRIDLTANEIKTIDEKAFLGLPELEELVIRENHLSQLPALPETMTLIDASHNYIGSRGIHKEAFKDMTSLLYLYLTDNNIDYIPVPLPDSLRSLHLQNNNVQMMHEDTFCNLKDFNYIRNALEDIRLDGNPINLSKTPQAYICLPRIPIGDLI
ncbi:epiphycan [Betta splendens]|uniref:Epiphycan n=1 Tax=Betta splendens TaxID=158456 RepID=A0A6P7NKE2_BETSP|nr:epiphycan [Betta splendens]XP_029017982.1 epiphycan [Betta splendens]XP_055367479.1 epiphycan [Betta splendens]XP_055367481.1 epiphycan [Betta splendens]XP_055367482.1 epiphycan [Betta splendens]